MNLTYISHGLKYNQKYFMTKTSSLFFSFSFFFNDNMTKTSWSRKKLMDLNDRPQISFWKFYFFKRKKTYYSKAKAFIVACELEEINTPIMTNLSSKI